MEKVFTMISIACMSSFLVRVLNIGTETAAALNLLLYTGMIVMMVHTLKFTSGTMLHLLVRIAKGLRPKFFSLRMNFSVVQMLMKKISTLKTEIQVLKSEIKELDAQLKDIVDVWKPASKYRETLPLVFSSKNHFEISDLTFDEGLQSHQLINETFAPEATL